MEQEQSFNVGGKFSFELVRDGKVIDQWEEKNVVVDEGLNHLLNVHLGATAKEPTWYVGLFESNSTPTSGWTAANVHAGDAVESTAYTETARPEWVEAPSTAQQITNTASKATFTISATKTMYGAFLISASAKDGTGDASAFLFSATRFTAPRDVILDDQLLITYTVEASSSV